MKHVSAVTEIVIIMAMMVSFIPLLAILLYQMKMSEYTFLDDKTQIVASAVEYKTVTKTVNGQTVSWEVPNLGEPKSYSVADIVLSMVIFDEYAPDSNVICVDERINKRLDMTVYDNFINKDDYISSWFNSSVDVLTCTSSYVQGSKPAHNKNTKFYLNYIPNAYTVTDSSGVVKSCPIWTFDHEYIDRIGVE